MVAMVSKMSVGCCGSTVRSAVTVAIVCLLRRRDLRHWGECTARITSRITFLDIRSTDPWLPVGSWATKQYFPGHLVPQKIEVRPQAASCSITIICTVQYFSQVRSKMLNQHPQGANWLDLSTSVVAKEADSNSSVHTCSGNQRQDFTEAPRKRPIVSIKQGPPCEYLSKDEATSELVKQILIAGAGDPTEAQPKRRLGNPDQ